ncbi:hypothetical protein C8Q72DRAFT_781875, partial [Fomitopsis betulina]
QLIFSVFKTLTDQKVTVELKNDLAITGVLKSVDQFLNIRLDKIEVFDEARHPHMMAVKNCFIRGSVVRYVQLPAEHVDTQLLEDATRRGAFPSSRVWQIPDQTHRGCVPGQTITAILSHFLTPPQMQPRPPQTARPRPPCIA